MEHFLALEASAGSGKTFALSIRYITLVLDGARVNEIIALTFTKKAASEMKSRIIESFVDLEKDSKKPERDEICKLLSLDEKSVLGLRDKSKNEFLNSNFKILTFDSFFSSILKSFALNIGLNPNFTIDDGFNEIKRMKFIEEICKNSELLELSANFALHSQSGINGFFDSIEELNMNNITLDKKDKAKIPSFAKIKDIVDKMRKFCVEKKANSRAINIFKDGGINEILNMSFMKYDTLNYNVFSKIYEPVLDDMFFELKDELKTYCDELEKYSLSELKEFLRLYQDVQIAMNKKFATLSFGDISSQTHRLFYDEKFDANMLYFRLDAKIKHLLIDEFQDTNIVQFEILKPLIDEIVAGYGQNGLGSFFYVGDKKQSIYRFRGGKKELFDKLMSDYAQIQKQSLDANYRSLKGIVKFVNFIFKDKIQGYIEQKSQSCKKMEESILHGAIKNNTNFTLFELEEDDFGYIKAKTAKQGIENEVSNEIKNLIFKGVNPQNITVLCWKNSDGLKIQDHLYTKNIKSSMQSTKALFDTPYVRAVIEYAKFCLSKEQIYAKNVEAILDKKVKWLELNLNKNALQTVKFISEILGISHDNEDVLLLFEVALKYTSIVDLIFSNDNTTSFYEESDGVRIMTVHKSKGLQFEHVILCDKFGKSPPNSKKFIYEYDIQNGWEIKQNFKKEHVDEEFVRFKEKSKLLDYEEDINKLYVAFTRAKKSLIIIKQNEPSGDRPSFFTPYKDKLYLDIDDFEFGFVIADEGPQESKKEHKKEIKLHKVALQEVKTQDKDDLDLGAIYFGNALHYTLEMCDKFDKNSLDTALKLSKNKYLKFIGEDAFDDIKKRILYLFSNEIFLQSIQNGEIYKEQPFKIANEIKQLDLMVEKDGKISIFDYKSSINFIDENVAQVEFYKDALSKIYKNKIVKASIIFLLKNECRILEV